MYKFSRARSACIVVVLMLALAAPALAQPASPIAIGPYVQNVGKDSATICWATVSGEVTYDPPRLWDKLTAMRSYNHHCIRLSYLRPGTTYTYDLLGDGSDAGKGSFTTFPEEAQPFHFVVVGDGRSHMVYQRILDRVVAEKPAMVFDTGDLVADGLEISHWESFFKVTSELMRSVPYYPALGNHEHDSRFYFDFFALPGNERYYSFNRGWVHFVVLDSPGPMMPETNQAVTKEQTARFAQYWQQYWQEQLAWFKQDLAGHQEAKYVFVFFHYPVYSVMSKRVEGARKVRELFGTVFQDYRVTAVFTGHDHHYHRAVAGGVQFVTTGGAGAPLYDIDAPQPETVKYAKAHHYVRVDVDAERAMARVIDIDGQMIDEFEMQPRAAGRAQ